MDLSKWLVDTNAIQTRLAQAQARNAEVIAISDTLKEYDDRVITAALDAAFTTDAPAPAAPPRAPRTRTTKTEVEANAAKVLEHADHEGQTARQLRELTGLDPEAFRAATSRLLRSDPPSIVCEGKGQAATWRLA